MHNVKQITISDFKSAAQINALYDGPGNLSLRAFTPHECGLRSMARASVTAAVLKLLREGSQETTKRVRALSEESGLCLPKARSFRPTLTGGHVVGQRFSLEGVLRGDPRPWSRWERGHISDGTKVISLGISVGGHHGYSGEELAWGPVAGLVIADILEAAGYRVELIGCNRAYLQTCPVALRFTLKEAQDPMDMNSLSRIAHPAFFRCFLLPMRRNLFDLRAGSGRTEPAEGCDFADPDVIVVPQVYTRADCERTIATTVAKFQE